VTDGVSVPPPYRLDEQTAQANQVSELSPTPRRRGRVLPGWLHSPTETSRRRSDSPPSGYENPTSAGYSRLCIQGRGFVPTGTKARPMGVGALPWSDAEEPVQSERLTSLAPRSARSDGTSGVNTRGSAAPTVGPDRGRPSYLSGSTSAPHIRGAIAPEPKGLS
jgi:hypothetical protein